MIAIVGRPNVGKSTLFNRLLGTRKAVVSSVPGTTRDRLYGQSEWRGRSLTLIDTGGYAWETRDGLAMAVQGHVQHALAEADGVLFLCDAQEGLVPRDALLMELLRKTGKPVVLAVNKADHRLTVPPEFFSLGVTPIWPISALHGRGISELLDDLTARVVPTRAPNTPSRPEPHAPAREPVAIAIVGRQNVGKSSLLNALLREDRVIVSDSPGTTRDAVDTSLRVDGASVTLIDTAGLRHRRKVKESVEFFAMARSLEAIGRGDVALVVLDGTQGVTRDDQRIITRVIEVGCGCVFLVNKWDLVTGSGRLRTVGPRRVTAAQLEVGLAEALRRARPSAAFAPVLAVSAKSGFQVSKILPAALRIARAMRTGLSGPAVLALVQRAWDVRVPPRLRGRPVKLQGAQWIGGRPSTILLTTSPPGRLPQRDERMLLKRLSTDPRLSNIPLRLVTGRPERR